MDSMTVFEMKVGLAIILIGVLFFGSGVWMTPSPDVQPTGEVEVQVTIDSSAVAAERVPESATVISAVSLSGVEREVAADVREQSAAAFGTRTQYTYSTTYTHSGDRLYDGEYLRIGAEYYEMSHLMLIHQPGSPVQDYMANRTGGRFAKGAGGIMAGLGWLVVVLSGVAFRRRRRRTP